MGHGIEASRQSVHREQILTFLQNKTLSDDADPLLALQGVSWFKRTIISNSTITLDASEYEEEGKTHIDISQTLSMGGLKGTTEKRTLDWQERGHNDSLFGDVKGKSRFTTIKDMPDSDDKDFLTKGWLDEDGGIVIQAWAESETNGWTAEQIWGFKEVDGGRHYARHVVVRKGKDWKQARLVYDWKE